MRSLRSCNLVDWQQTHNASFSAAKQKTFGKSRAIHVRRTQAASEVRELHSTNKEIRTGGEDKRRRRWGAGRGAVEGSPCEILNFVLPAVQFFIYLTFFFFNQWFEAWTRLSITFTTRARARLFVHAVQKRGSLQNKYNTTHKTRVFSGAIIRWECQWSQRIVYEPYFHTRVPPGCLILN